MVDALFMNFKKSSILIVLLAALTANAAFSDDSKGSITDRKTDIQLFSGILFLSSIDELYSSLLFSGNGPLYGIKSTFQMEKMCHQLSFYYAGIYRSPRNVSAVQHSTDIASRYSKFQTHFIKIDYFYLHQLGLFKKDYSHFFWSVGLTNTLNITDDYFLISEIIMSGIAPGFYYQFNRKRNHLSAGLHIPVLVLDYRYSYYTALHQDYENLDEKEYFFDNLRLESVNRIFSINIDSGYEYAINQNIGIDVTYAFSYLSSKYPRSLRSVTNQYTIGMSVKF